MVEQTMIRVEHLSDEQCRAEAGPVLDAMEARYGVASEHSRVLKCFVETDAVGDALRYRLNVFGPAGGAPVAIWHRHPGHEAHDGGPCHLHRHPGRSPTGTMSFAGLNEPHPSIMAGQHADTANIYAVDTPPGRFLVRPKGGTAQAPAGSVGAGQFP